MVKCWAQRLCNFRVYLHTKDGTEPINAVDILYLRVVANTEGVRLTEACGFSYIRSPFQRIREQVFTFPGRLGKHPSRLRLPTSVSC